LLAFINYYAQCFFLDMYIL